jgi:NADPH2:quinone reductase
LWQNTYMKAAYFTRTGPPEVIQYGDLPDPRPGPGQCLVKVVAVDVNPIDTYIRAGLVPSKPVFPAILGRDLAGTVVECGPGVKRFNKGDRVWATNQGLGDRPGTFSELAAVDEKWLYPIPSGVGEEDIVALSLVAVTAQLGLVRKAQLKLGEILFVNGGAGGVGSCVVQMAKSMGAKVIATAGSDAKADACRQLGADVVINYQTDDVDEAIKRAAPDGVNVWWETLRQPDFDRAVPLLAMRGRYVLMAGRDAKPVFPVGPFYVKDCSLHGFAMFNGTPEELRSAAEDINRWVAEGKLKARIDRVLPLSAAMEAHRLQEDSTIRQSGVVSGKIVLRV